MYSEDELIPLSGLQHFAFCERRWALVHIEGVWAENRFTAEGRLLHERVHGGGLQTAPGIVTRRAMPVRSFRLGLTGHTDVVEFHPIEDATGVVLAGHRGVWRPYPIEYKRRRDVSGSPYAIQLCAQAMCLEEMLKTTVPAGAIYDGKTRRRQPVAFDEAIRSHVVDLSSRMHTLLHLGKTPGAVYESKCEKCSLVNLCLPKATGGKSAVRYLERAIAATLSE